MNKSLLTNAVALTILVAGLVMPHPLLEAMGLFAVSGAVTNWLAIHMLFERVPGLYGSGVIPRHFEEFRRGIRSLMLDQFFTTEQIQRFLSEKSGSEVIDLGPVIDQMDLSPTFDSLVSTIEESPYGGMLAMIGGIKGLSGLRTPYTEKIQSALKKIAASEPVQQAIRDGISEQDPEEIRERICQIIEKRLQELTPELVKQIIQDMIRTHLGWLVVWGGVLGGLIGLASTQI